MNFIWDIVLNAKEHGTDEEDLFFRPAEECSPWFEQAFPVLNEAEAEGPEIEYNPLYRFDFLFHDLLHKDLTKSPEFRAYLFDAVTHLLVQTDLHHGLTRRELYIRRLLLEMEQGGFGPSVANKLQVLEPDKRERLSSLALTQLQIGSSLLLFRKAALVLFPEALVYQERTEPKHILLYVGRERSKAAEHGAELIEEMFLPMGFYLRVFWAHHFGVLGVDSTMQTDGIEIY